MTAHVIAYRNVHTGSTESLCAAHAHTIGDAQVQHGLHRGVCAECDRAWDRQREVEEIVYVALGAYTQQARAQARLRADWTDRVATAHAERSYGE